MEYANYHLLFQFVAKTVDQFANWMYNYWNYIDITDFVPFDRSPVDIYWYWHIFLRNHQVVLIDGFEWNSNGIDRFLNNVDGEMKCEYMYKGKKSARMSVFHYEIDCTLDRSMNLWRENWEWQKSSMQEEETSMDDYREIEHFVRVLLLSKWTNDWPKDTRSSRPIYRQDIIIDKVRITQQKTIFFSCTLTCQNRWVRGKARASRQVR